MAEKKKATPAKKTAARRTAPTAPDDTEPAEEVATEVVDSPTDPADERPKIRLTGAEWNRAIPGILTYHYITRDVELPADGESAAKVLKFYEENYGGKTLDVLNPSSGVAHRGWMIFETEGLLGISWRPLHIRPQRITVDPVTRSSRHFTDQLEGVEIVDAA